MKTLLYCLLAVGLAACLPQPPRYPQFNAAQVNREATALSDSLEAYIRRWHRGQAPAQLPARVLPTGYDPSRYQNLRLVKFEDLDPKLQWAVRPAHTIDFSRLYGSFPDPHCTYLLAPVLYAPFGAKLRMEGEFPYCRFFSIQVSPPFDPAEYRYDKWSGKGEVSLVDADIEPEPGHTNPFRPNGDRLATRRRYTAEFQMALGNPTALNPVAHKFPYRGRGPRYASGIQFQGPWGLDKKSGHGRGLYDFGDVWVRYFGIDHDKMPSAGVPLPKLYFELKTGERFFIVADFAGLIKASEATMPNRDKGNSDPAKYNGPTTGWDKQFGIFLQISTGLSRALYKEAPRDRAYVRALDLGVNGRGENQPPPANYEPHATSSNYTGYLTTGTSIKKGKVFVLAGKLPTFPDTRRGAKTLAPAQMRYWSITSYDAEFPFSEIKGLENTSVMDDELVLNANREYIIVYSRQEDRPRNATAANGVTWVDWGRTCIQSFTLRWISVGPEWSFDLAPHEENLPWAKSTWSGSQHDPSLVGTNQPGFLRDYHPVKHYLTKEAFEQLGDQVTAKKLPEWR
jgi:hypothetical protein